MESKRKKAEEEKRKLARKQAIIANVRVHSGPCLKPSYVDKIINQYTTQHSKLEALSSEVQYRKTILGQKHNLLKRSGLEPKFVD